MERRIAGEAIDVSCSADSRSLAFLFFGQTRSCLRYTPYIYISSIMFTFNDLPFELREQIVVHASNTTYPAGEFDAALNNL